MNAHAGQLALNVHLVVARVVLIAPERVGHHRNRKSQVPFQLFRLGHVGGHLAEHVVVVPRINKAHVLAPVAEGTDNQINGNYLAEIADVDST